MTEYGTFGSIAMDHPDVFRNKPSLSALTLGGNGYPITSCQKEASDPRHLQIVHSSGIDPLAIARFINSLTFSDSLLHLLDLSFSVNPIVSS